MPCLFDIEYKTLADFGVKGGNLSAVVVDCAQGSQDWFGSRLGIMTASNAALLITSKGEPAKSKSLDTFMNGCIAEQLLGTVECNTASTPAMERGTNLEPRARAWYAIDRDVDVREAGFVFRDESKTSGASPDGLCADRCLEIKCPMRKGMIGARLGIEKTGKAPTQYLAQMQFQMWCFGLDLCDFVLYTPEPQIPNAIVTVEADPVAQKNLTELVPAFAERVDAGVKVLAALQDDGDFQ
tara:strand:+ start:954 stop:1673 length:720 start_codon:yes stop_codon:yes gene_type:complete